MLCPYCNEEIKDGAKKCRFCGEFLEETKSETKHEEHFEEKTYGVLGIIISLNIIIGILTLVFYGIGLIFLIGAWIQKKRKLEITTDGVVISHGIINKSKETIPFSKINSVDVNSTFGIADLVIRTGNDKPTIFKYIEKHDEVVAEIKKHIKK